MAVERPDADDVDALLRQFRRTQDRRIRNAVVYQHRRLSEIVAEDYVNRGIERDDLRQIALLGLVKAVERFDLSVGTPFATFASITMNGEIKRHFRDSSWDIRPPRRLQELNREVRKASDELSQTMGRSPSVAELAIHLETSRERVIEALAASAAYRADHLDTPSSPDEGPGSSTRMDLLETEDQGFDHTERSQLIQRLLATLPDRDAEILRLRFWEELTQEEIAARVGVSQMHVSRLLRRSMHRLRARADIHDEWSN